MKFILFLSLLFFNLQLKGEPDNLASVRELFYKGVEDESAVEKLENMLIAEFSSTISDYPPVIMAYAGGVEALKAKHAFSPFTKFSHLLKSLDLLESAVKLAPEELEIRFIRFSILDNIPSFLGYGEERDSDRKVIIKELLKKDFSSVGRDIQQGMAEYLLKSSNLTAREKLLLSKNLSARKDKE